MIYVGIDVSKDKHDCCILSSYGEILVDVFTVTNDINGFDLLLQTILSCEGDMNKVKVGLEATGHYSYNLLGYLLDKGLTTYVINPLHTNLFRKGITLWKTKTDKVDSRAIAAMLLSGVVTKPYTQASYHNEELKSLTRYRFDKVSERGKLRQSVSRLVTILFPELERLVSSLHLSCVYALLAECPGAQQIASQHLTHLTNLLYSASKGRYGRQQALLIRDAARRSVGSVMPAKSMELQHTIRLIRELTVEINEIESAIRDIIDKLNPPILTVPGIGFRTATMILSEVGDFSRFDSPDKLLAYAGLSPSTYQSGKLNGTHARMEKRGSRYLRYAIIEAAKRVCRWEPAFSVYLAKKRPQGKHYNVAVSHAAKKLVRMIYAIQTSEKPYRAVC